MNYIGIDLHRRFSQFYVYDDQKNTESTQRINNDKPAIQQFLEPLGDECKIAVEATGNWYWLVDLLQDLDLEVRLANPLQTKVIAHARAKNDKIDARMLAHLLRTNLLPTCWIPEKEERNMRELLRIRLRLLRFRTQHKNYLRSILAKFNITIDYRNIWRGSGRDVLETYITPTERQTLEHITLPTPYREATKQVLRNIDFLSDQIEYWEKIINNQADQSADAQHLLTVPGIGKLSALTILYETGPVDRFPCAKHYASYAGMVPRTMISANKHRHGHLFKQSNMYLKRIYIETAKHILHTQHSDIRLRDFHNRLSKRKGNGIATVALARKIAMIVYHMLKEKIDFATAMTRNQMAGPASV